MIRHIVLITLRPDAPPEAARAIVDALKRLPAVIPSVREYQAGVDGGIVEGNATLAVTATFDDAAGYLQYRDHPAHKDVIERYIDPFRESRTAVQFEI